MVHYQMDTKLVFIYSQLKSELIYNAIINSFAISPQKIAKHEMNRVLGKLHEFEIFNSGMQNRFNESGESYRISAGTDVSEAIDPSTGKLYSAGHVFCKALSEENPITIGYSSGAKIWSSSYLFLKDYIRWCDLNGLKISNSEIKVKTNTNFDFLPIPKRLKGYPSNIFMADFSGNTYSNPPSVYLNQNKRIQELLIDSSIKIKKIENNHIIVLFNLNGVEEEVICDINGNYSSCVSKIFVSEGRGKIKLSDYLNDYPLIYRTTDDVMIQGMEYTQGDPNGIIFNSDNIIPIKWIEKYATDISVEISNDKDNKNIQSIQETLQEILEENGDFEYIIYDHSTGEIADFITVLEKEYEFEITFYHVKKMGSKNYNSSVEDVYEVAGQAVKSIIWLKTKSILLDKIVQRRKSEHCIFIRGEYEDFKKKIKSQDKMIKGKVVIVQPAISKSNKMPNKIQEILAAATYYISNSGKVKSLKIWGSD